jgi:adenylate cyclase
LFVVTAIGAVAFGVAYGFSRTPFGRRVEDASYDLRVRSTSAPLPNAVPIVLIDISETSIRTLEPVVGRWPWPRAVHAAAIDYITGGGAKAIVYDVLFLEREGDTQRTIAGRAVTGHESDRALVLSVRSAGNVVLLGDATYEGSAMATSLSPPDPPDLPGPAFLPGQGFEARPRFQMPFDELRFAARAIGHNFQRRDEGSDYARSVQPFIEVGGVAVPSLGLAAAIAYLDVPPDSVKLEGDALVVGQARLPLESEPVRSSSRAIVPARQAVLRFAEPKPDAAGVMSTFEAYSFIDVLMSPDQIAAGKPPAVPASVFKDKLVFIGTSGAGLYDSYQTPFRTVGGVELHATLAANLVTGQFMRRASREVDIAVTAAAAIVSAAAAVFLSVISAVVAVLLLATGLVAGLTWLVGHGHWLAVIPPGLAALTALFLGVAWQYFVEGRQKREIKKLFGRYVSKDVIDELIANPELARLGGQLREMTVLFSDIRGFTTASERSTPEAVVLQLNEYFGAMVEVLFRHRGTLDKFVGDMVMGLFGAPLDDPDHADHAVACALEMVEELDRLNVKWRAEGKTPLDIGIGINTGEMIAGNVGAESVMSYTVIGDAVNLGSRLESLNKEYGTRILISEATRSRLKQPVRTRLIGDVKVKGKHEAVQVHELLSPGDSR